MGVFTMFRRILTGHARKIVHPFCAECFALDLDILYVMPVRPRRTLPAARTALRGALQRIKGLNQRGMKGHEFPRHIKKL